MCDKETEKRLRQPVLQPPVMRQPVYLNMRENTNTVTVTIPGLDPYTATFIFGNPRLERMVLGIQRELQVEDLQNRLVLNS